MLLLPPLVMATGVIVFGSSSQQGSEPGGRAQQAAASQTVVTKSVLLAERSDGVTSFTLASAQQYAVIIEQYPVAENRPGTEQPSATAQGQASGQPRVAKDPSPYDAPPPIITSEQPAVTDATRYHGPNTVTLVHVRKSTEQSAMADIEAAPSTVRSVQASRAVTRIHASHASRKMGRHASRSVSRVKQERARLLNEPRRIAGVAGLAGTDAGARRTQGYQSQKVRLR
jgi:hypothetical protein